MTNGDAADEVAADSDRIRALDERTVAQIAAGEVVERPASVVKELVENSLDAGATSIDVTVADGGREHVVVADDGHGMTPDDLRAAVRQHTTSKLGDASDLDTVGTLGFRGEALYTIGSVSRMTVSSRARDAGDSGAELTVDHGEVGDLRPAGRPAGTTVEVEDLFAETPARRKYLKQASTEFAHVNRAVTRYALANPEVAVSLTHDGREVFATTGSGDVKDAALAVYGREVAQSLREVEATPEGPVERVHGYVSDPEVTRATREYLATFVNGRSVRDATIREAVLDAYGGQLANDRYPFAVLFVDCEGVDANVHPRKMEVRFEQESAVKDAVENAVREALLDAGLVRSQAPRGASKPGDAEISPGPGGGDTERSVQETDTVTEHSTGEPAPELDSGAGDSAGGQDDGSLLDPGNRESLAAPSGVEGQEQNERGASADDAGNRTARDTTFDPPTENARLVDDGEDAVQESDAGDEQFDSLPDLRVLGQVHDTYVVAEAADGLVLVDQHAADERIHYERLRERLDGTSQSLVAPVDLELTAGEAAVFEAAIEDLQDLGFQATLDGRTVSVEAVPAVLADTLDPELARDVLAGVLTTDGDEAVEAAADDLLADIACHPAIKGNTSLAEGRVVALLDALDDCENPYACPHGRPTVIRVGGDELADRFERDYPGHGSRRRED
jgi:DNA mismatch repair protein MutL